VCFFGDGAINRGPFLEGLNWARVYNLPILFVCEDNAWSATTFTRALSAGPGPAARAEALGIPAFDVDGNDVEAVDRIAGELVAKVRGGGPAFLVASTYRLKGHTAADPGTYRKAEEVEAQRARDPLPRTARRLQALGVAAAAVEAVAREAAAELDAAYATARDAPWPDLALAFTDVLDTGAGTWR